MRISLTHRHPRFRILLPVVFIIIDGSLLGKCVLSLGHSSFCDYGQYLMFPTYLMTDFLSQLLVIRGTVDLSSGGWKFFGRSTDGSLTIPSHDYSILPNRVRR